VVSRGLRFYTWAASAALCVPSDWIPAGKPARTIGAEKLDASVVVENWVSDLVYLSGDAIACAVYVFVGARLYRLSRRTGQFPELLIGASFLLWAACYLFYDVPYAIYRSDELVPAFCSYSSLLTLALGNVAFVLFIRSVFRPRSRWADALVVAIALCVVLGLAGTAWRGDWEGIDPIANPGYWLDHLATVAPAVWMTAEGFAHYFRARRRLKLGFCEPMDCHRFLLWGVAGALFMILEGITTASDLVNALTGSWSAHLTFGVAFFEVAPVAVIWLVFFPPSFYRRWIGGPDARRAAKASDR